MSEASLSEEAEAWLFGDHPELDEHIIGGVSELDNEEEIIAEEDALIEDKIAEFYDHA